MTLRQKLDDAVQILFQACIKGNCFPGNVPTEVDGKISTHAVLEALGVNNPSPSQQAPPEEEIPVAAKATKIPKTNGVPNTDKPLLPVSCLPSPPQSDQSVSTSPVAVQQQQNALSEASPPRGSQQTTKSEPVSNAISCSPKCPGSQPHQCPAPMTGLDHSQVQKSIEEAPSVRIMSHVPTDNYKAYLAAISSLPRSTAQAIYDMHPAFATFLPVNPSSEFMFSGALSSTTPAAQKYRNSTLVSPGEGLINPDFVSWDHLDSSTETSSTMALNSPMLSSSWTSLT